MEADLFPCKIPHCISCVPKKAIQELVRAANNLCVEIRLLL